MGGVIPVIFASSCFGDAANVLQLHPPATRTILRLWSTRIHTFFQSFHGGDPYYELVFLLDYRLSRSSTSRSSSTSKRLRTTCVSTAASCRAFGPAGTTAEFLNTILTRLTTVGAIYLVVVALIPQIMLWGFKRRASAVCWCAAGRVRQQHARTGLGSARYGLSVLLRRHLSTDPRRRCDGHGRADRGAARHA